MKRIDFGEENRLFKSGNGSARAPREADLPELGVRILGDFARIAAAKARLVETTVIGVAQAFVDRLYVASIVMVLELAGVIAVVGASAHSSIIGSRGGRCSVSSVSALS